MANAKNEQEILSKIINIEEEYNLGTYDLQSILKKNDIIKQEKKMVQRIKENAVLVGKCFRIKNISEASKFPDMYHYFKVISNRASNQFRVSVLTFKEYPTYWFDYQTHRFAPEAGDYINGSFVFSGIKINSILASTLSGMEEIPEKEFNKKMLEYTERLLKLQFYADHWRFGNVLPEDEKWTEAEDALSRKQ